MDLRYCRGMQGRFIAWEASARTFRENCGVQDNDKRNIVYFTQGKGKVIPVHVVKE